MIRLMNTRHCSLSIIFSTAFEPFFILFSKNKKKSGIKKGLTWKIFLEELFDGFSQFFSRWQGTVWNFRFAIRLHWRFIFIACSSLLKLQTLFSQNWIFQLRPFSMPVIQFIKAVKSKNIVNSFEKQSSNIKKQI